MKIKSNRVPLKAVCLFTDREEPRAAFWRKYNIVKSELQQECNVHVLNYYGIGGIGKSSLLKKLMQEMDEKLALPQYIHIDMNICQESRAILEKMKNKLIDTYSFNFPLFDVGSYVYAQKIGEKVSPLEVQTLTEKSPLLSLIMSIAGDIPVLGIAAKVLSAADQGVSIFRSHLKNHSRELRQIEVMEAEDLYKKLPLLFALDLSHNLENSKEPLVVFFDTYEKLVNELSAVGEPLKVDEWIKGEEGLVQNIPHILWVIAGREKLKWERFNLEWRDAIESHILGNLSQTDSEHFLELSGISDGELRSQLYALTKGTPVYLDLCVDQFLRMHSEGKIARISAFGKNTFDLIERFMRYMGDAQKDLVYMLACLDKWDDALITDIATTILPNFSWTSYEKAKDYSFIISSADGVYNIHQTVGNILRDNCPSVISNKVRDSLVRRFSNVINEKSVFSLEFIRALTYITQAGLLHRNRHILYMFYIETIRRPLIQLYEAGRFEAATSVFDMLFEKAEQKKSDLLYASVVGDRASLLEKTGEYEAAKQLAETSLNLYARILGEDHPDTLSMLHNIATIFIRLGKYDKALVLNQMILEKQESILGGDHLDTISTMHNAAAIHSKLGENDKAFELYQTVLEKRKAILGEDHPDTLSTLHNIATIFIHLGKYDKALVLNQMILEKRRIILGDNHLDTISTMRSLADILVKLRKDNKAFELYQTILKKQKAVLGDNHPNTLSTMSSMAIMLSKLGEREKAIALHQSLLEKRTIILGDDHPDTILSMDGLAYAFIQVKAYAKAFDLYQRILEKRKTILGDNHPDTITTMNNLAVMLGELGKDEEALELYLSVFRKLKTILGEDHPDTITAQYNIACVSFNLKRCTSTLEILKAVIEKRKAVLGDDHSDTITAINTLSMVKRIMDDGEKQ